MSLPMEIQNEIRRYYSLRQNENSRIEAAQKAEIFQAVPEIQRISEEIANASVRCAKASIFQGSASHSQHLQELKETLTALVDKRNELLTAHGYGKDALKPHYTCPHCHDTGMVGAQKCHCYKQFVINQLYKQSNLPSVTTQNFETLRMDFYPKDLFDKSGRSVYDRMKHIISYCKNYAAKFSAENAASLLLCGATGTSKTFLCSCIAKAVMDQGYSVVYMAASDVFDRLHQYTWSFSSEEENSCYLYQLFDCDLLIIDDLGSEPETANTANYFFRCINERLIRKNSTIISTNHELSELNQIYTQRVVDRITSDPYTCILTTDGVDFNVRLGGNTQRFSFS